MQRLMNPPSLLRQILVRVFLTALLAALLATLASCGSPDAGEPGLELIRSQIDELNESVSDSQEQADRLVFWQITVAVLIVVSGFALIFGAAMGSIARREVLRRVMEAPNPSSDIESPTHPHPKTQTQTNHENADEKLR